MFCFSVVLKKLRTEYAQPIRYFVAGKDAFCLNDVVGHRLKLSFLGSKFCVKCSRKINKTFMDGYCYICFKNSPETAECVIRPELCRAHLPESNPNDWELSTHNQPHIVYFSFTSHLKVGVTRKGNEVYRWIDQGAIQALVVAETPNRYLAGCIEKALSRHMSDRTHWSKMILQVEFFNQFVDIKEKMTALCHPDLLQYFTHYDDVKMVSYPRHDSFPIKIKSCALDKCAVIDDVLVGVKGQYLVFESGIVFNVRKHSGYEVEFECFT